MEQLSSMERISGCYIIKERGGKAADEDNEGFSSIIS